MVCGSDNESVFDVQWSAKSTQSKKVLLNSRPGPFCVKFAFSPCFHVASPSPSKDIHWGFDHSNLPIGVNVSV